MELDLLYEIDAPKPWPEGQAATERKHFMECIEQVKLADKVGFRTVWCVEHHFREQRSHMSAPEVVIGALSQVTENIHLGFGVMLMPHPFRHPIRAAEVVATADLLSNGRIEWGTGRSTPMEQAAFGVPVGEENRAQWREAVETVIAAWESEGDSFSWKSDNLTFPARPEHHDTRSITPKPLQKPHPPVWCAGVTANSAKVVGEAGLGFLSFSILQGVDEMADHIKTYREAQERAKPMTKVHTNKVAAYTLVHCAETAAKAEENGAWDAVWWWYQNYAELGLEWDFRELSDEQKEQMFPLLNKYASGDFKPKDFSDADMIIVGDVEECIEKMLKYKAAGVDELICYSQFGPMGHEAVMENIELLGTKVLPELKKRDIDVNLKFKKADDISGFKFKESNGAALTPGGVSSQSTDD